MQDEAMHVGRWMSNGVNNSILAKYLDSPKIEVNAGDGKNIVIIKDSVVIVSRMFPFYDCF
jgi:hypothetical protein